MREINVREISNAVKDMCISANYNLGNDVVKVLEASRKTEESPVAKGIIDNLIKNSEIAREKSVPMCQDTGMAVIFVELGQEVRLVGGDLKEAINEGVRQGYKEGFLRKLQSYNLSLFVHVVWTNAHISDNVQLPTASCCL